MEDIFFFKGKMQQNLLGFIHQPDIQQKSRGLIYLHPFAEEKNCAHSICVGVSRRLARMGYPVMRFDFTGCGDSEGEFEKTNLDQWLQDIKDALRVFKDKTGVREVCLWGLRTGAALAMLAIRQIPEINHSILWQPVLNLNRFISQMVRHLIIAEFGSETESGTSVKDLINRLESGEPIEVLGYKISQDLYQSFIKHDHILLKELDVNLKLTVFSVSQLDQPSYVLKKDLNQLRKLNLKIEHRHIQMEPFWDRYWRWTGPEIESHMMDILETSEHG
jgi:exosortase A-associated hydrolase 2